MENKKIKLGQKFKDKVTGFTGIAIAECEYLNGCIQFEISPTVDDKGDKRKNQWIDQQQLEIVDNGILAKPKARVFSGWLIGSGGGHRSHPE